MLIVNVSLYPENYPNQADAPGVAAICVRLGCPCQDSFYSRFAQHPALPLFTKGKGCFQDRLKTTEEKVEGGIFQLTEEELSNG